MRYKARLRFRTPQFRTQAKQFTWFIVGAISLPTVTASGMILTVGPFPTLGSLYLHYLAFSVAIIALLHAAFFSLNLDQISRKGQTLSPNLPRYLEYAYAALLSIGLAQVYFQPHRFAEFIDFTTDPDGEIVERVKTQAAKHLAHDCPSGGNKFPPWYCAKLRLITTTQPLQPFLLAHVAKDTQFLEHVIDVVGGPQGPVALIRSPITRDVDRLRARHEFSQLQDRHTTRLFNWIALLLLPLGIGLRVLKTSLELFARLGTTTNMHRSIS